MCAYIHTHRETYIITFEGDTINWYQKERLTLLTLEDVHKRPVIMAVARIA